MKTVDLTPDQAKNFAKSTDRYNKTIEKLGDQLAQATGEAGRRYAQSRAEALMEHQGLIIEIAEENGIDPKTIQRFDVDRFKNTISFTVVEAATPKPTHLEVVK